MKTLNQTDNVTFSETSTGRFQVTDKNITYCFGDCLEWAERFFYKLIFSETTIQENAHAKIVYCEAWGYTVVDKKVTRKDGRPFRYTVTGLENCRRWVNEITEAREHYETVKDRLTVVDTRSGAYNLLLNANTLNLK